MTSCEKGVSYLQILIASSVIASLAIIGIKLMEDQKRVVVSTTQSFEINSIINEISLILADPASCRASLSNNKIPSSKTSIKNIKRELVGGKSGEGTRFIKFQTFDSSEKIYGQKTLKISSYKLLNIGVEKTQINLEVRFDRGENSIGARYKLKKIPLKVILDDENRIVSCQTSFESLGDATSWNKDVSGNLHYDGKVNIGKTKGNATLNLERGLKLITTQEKPKCDFTFRGGLIWDKEIKRFVFCDGRGEWRVFGKPERGLSNSKFYTLSLSVMGSESIQTKNHQACFFTRIKKNLKSGNCLLKASEETRPTTWTIQNSSQSSVVAQTCEVMCLN